MNEFTTNPLLNWTITPAYDQIKPEHVEPGVTAAIAHTETEIAALEAAKPTRWADFYPQMERAFDLIQRVWGVVSHLNGVKNSPELREAYQKMQGRIVQLLNRIGQSRPLYETYCALRDGEEWATYDEGQRRTITQAIQQAEQAGVGLDGAARERFNQISERLAELGNQFGNNSLDATKAYQLWLTTAEEIAGLPASTLAQAASAAQQAGKEEATAESGPWLITLDQPSYLGFLKNSQRRDLRQQVYMAYVTRATSGELNNAPLVREMLDLRQELAELLGYNTYAELSLSTKMAPSVTAVEGLLNDLRTAARPAGERDLAQLVTAARAAGDPAADDFQMWDVYYWTERVRESEFALSDEALRPYFPLPRVLEGMFSLVTDIFGIRVAEASEGVPVWHEDVQYFKVFDAATDQQIAGFFFDPYSRPAEKRGGAWMDVVVTRSAVLAPEGTAVRLPIAYMICNQTPPVDGKPSLMTFYEVTTLFHEFGHVLHHLLTTVDNGFVAGVAGVEWDAIELPSQFMENWCYYRPTLNQLAAHYETGESLPDETLNRILAARNYQSGYATLRQLYFGLFDMTLHHHFDTVESVHEVQQRIGKETAVIPYPPEDQFYATFGHLFGGPYGAGYYSYKWAEVLSADAFGAFEEAGLDNKATVETLGRRFRDTVLAAGGSRDPMAVYREFRGRDPRVEALLKQDGLI
ncbi:MAG: M3 family metallopeptidase [Chloroflexi bacterium]|nr:M3 family metallopeptidase [Chloroflexota bacterium]